MKSELRRGRLQGVQGVREVRARENAWARRARRNAHGSDAVHRLQWEYGPVQVIAELYM